MAIFSTRSRQRYCNCGKYRPKSTKGLINTDCANCGGKKRRKKLR